LFNFSGLKLSVEQEGRRAYRCAMPQ